MKWFFFFLHDAGHVQGAGSDQFHVLPDSSVTFFKVEGVSLNVNGCVVQWRLNKTGTVCMIVTLRRVRVTIFFCHGRTVSITYSECVSVTLGIQHAKRMRFLYCHLCPAWLYNIFPHYFLNGTILGKVIEYKMCFEFLCNLSLE